MKRKAYETPNVTRSVILMEDGVMAASGDAVKETKIELQTTEHEYAGAFDVTGDWQ